MWELWLWGAPGSLYEALGGLGWDCSCRRGEAYGGERDEEGKVPVSVGLLPLRNFIRLTRGSYLTSFSNSIHNKEKKVWEHLEKYLLISCIPFHLHLQHGDRE